MDEVHSLLTDFKNLERANRKLFLSKLLAYCDPYDLHLLQQSLLKQGHGPFDILSSLPTEVAQRVMSYLDARDLCRCQQVCKTWRIPSLDPDLWRRQYNILTRALSTTRRVLPPAPAPAPTTPSPFFSIPKPLPSYHALYRYLHTRDQNWTHSRPQYTIPLSLPHQKVHAVRLRDPYLAVVYASPPELWVYDLGGKSELDRRNKREQWWWPSVDTYHTYNDVNNKTHTRYFRTCFSAPLTQKASCVDLLPERGIVAVGTYLRECHVWTTRPQPRLLHTLRGGHVAAVTHVALNARYVATGGYDRTVVAWSIESGEKVAVFDALHFSISGLTLHPTHHRLLIASGHDGTLESFDVMDDTVSGRALGVGTTSASARMLFLGPRPRALAAMSVDNAKGGWGEDLDEDDGPALDDDEEPLARPFREWPVGAPIEAKIACFWYDTVIVYRGDLLGDGGMTGAGTSTAAATTTMAAAAAAAAANGASSYRPARITTTATAPAHTHRPTHRHPTPPRTPSPSGSIASSSSSSSSTSFSSSSSRLHVWETRTRGEIVAGALCGRRVVVATDRSGYFAERTGPGVTAAASSPPLQAIPRPQQRYQHSSSGSGDEAVEQDLEAGESEIRLDVYSLPLVEDEERMHPHRKTRAMTATAQPVWRKDRPIVLRIPLEDVVGVEEGANNARIRAMEVDEERIVVVFRGGSGVVVGFGER